MVALDTKDMAVPDGSHVTHLSMEENEALEVATGFIMKGLKDNDTVCIIAPKDKTDNLLAALNRNSTNLKRFIESGKLHLSRGMATPDGHMQYLMKLAAQSGGGFRVFGDMTWTKEKGWSAETLIRFEETVNQSTRPRGCLLLCQYPLESFTGTEIMMAIEKHTHNIYSGRIHENPYSG
jgi:transcriptional repressor of dcmA and dcmR